MRIRPYEVSLWTLQDSFIAILGSNETLNYRGRIYEGEIQLKTDGTQNFSFSINSKIFNGTELVDNPLWYDYQRGLLMANLRKVKVIFNKRIAGKEKVYEFVISKVEDSHEKNGILTCHVECEGLAFQELGKIGYKISLGQETFEEVYEEWFNSTDENKGAPPIANLKFWADKLFKDSSWKYKTNFIQNGENSEILYEEEYVSSWKLSEDKIIPNSVEEAREKARIFTCEKGNLYNYSQLLAETFGVYCRYEFEYDDNYHIISKTCVFYNSFFIDQNNRMVLTYPYDTEVFNRTMESKDLVSKMYVIPIEDSNYEGGMITIASSDANKSKEDYILNFDYLYEIEAINDVQYAEIPNHLEKLRIFNEKIDRCSSLISELQNELVELEGEKVILENSLSLCNERCNEAKNMIDALVGNEAGILSKNKYNPEITYLLQQSNGRYEIKISQEGVDASSIKVYKKYNSFDKNYPLTEQISLTGAIYNYDSNGNLISIINITSPSGDGLCYLTYNYNPTLHYENIYNTYFRLKTKNQNRINEIDIKIENYNTSIETLTAEYNKNLNDKKEEIKSFELMMGPALKEGYWQPEGYQDYGERRTAIISSFSEVVEDDYETKYDSNLLDGELESGYREGVEQNYYQYPRIITTGSITLENYDKITLFSIGPSHKEGSFDDVLSWSIGSQLRYGYINNGQLVIYLYSSMFKEWSDLKGEAGEERTLILGIDKSYFSNSQLIFSYETLFEVTSDDIVFGKEKNNVNEIPRIIIKNSLIKTDSAELLINTEDVVFEKYYDYYILYNKSGYPCVNFKPESLIKSGGKNINIDYFISNAATAIYLDALQVSKSNAFPQVSYEVSLTNRKEEEMQVAYNWLGSLALINDYDLKLFTVQGYISEVLLVLDEPWLDKISVQNYKTQFEDLFAKIVSSSESMKMKELVYDRISSAFIGGSNIISENALQTAFDSSNLQLAFEKGNLQINEKEGIWGVSDEGVVAYRGGGIFCATEKDKDNNWLWNTGITPSGINASLLTAGQIDTNLIRIFAGNNVRLQLNKDGLIAYKSNAEGLPDPDNYVIHEGEGLFFRSKQKVRNEETSVEEDVFVDKVAISWDGLSLKNNNNETVFYADENGNLRIKGHIEATSGNIDTLIVNKLIEVKYPQLTIFAQDGSIFNNNEPNYLRFTIAASLFEIKEEADFSFYNMNSDSEVPIEYTNSIDDFEKGLKLIYFNNLIFYVKNDIILNEDILKLKIKCAQDSNVYETQTEIYWIKDGEQGPSGPSGKDGVTILETQVSYALGSEEEIPLDEASWKNDITELVPENNEVIWIRTITKYSDENLNTVAYSRSGADGKNGSGISSTIIEYQILEENILPSDISSGWGTEIPTEVVPQGYILWTRTTFLYTNSDKTEIIYTKGGSAGADGEDGNGIQQIIFQYAVASENANPSEITSWSLTFPTDAVPVEMVLWTKMIINYTNGGQEITYTKGGSKGDSGSPGLDGESTYSAIISSSNGDSFKSTTDWAVLYCTVLKGEAIVQTPWANLFFLEGNVPTGTEYSNKYYYLVRPEKSPEFVFYQYDSSGETSAKVEDTSSFPEEQFSYKWTVANQYGIQNPTSISSNNMIYVSRDLVDTKATYFCEVSKKESAT